MLGFIAKIHTRAKIFIECIVQYYRSFRDELQPGSPGRIEGAFMV